MIGDLALAVLGTVAKAFGSGGSMTVRRGSSLRGAGTVFQANDLELAADASSGATTLSLRISASDASLAGSCPAGAVLTIGAATYTTTADATALSGVVALAITPALPGALLTGVDVSVGPAVFSLSGCLRQDPRVTLPADLAGRVASSILVPQSGAPSGWAPRNGDFLTDHTGQVSEVVGFAGLVAGNWELYLGAARAKAGD